MRNFKKKNKFLTALFLLGVTVSLSACGEEEEAEEKMFGGTYSEELAEIAPEQVVCAQGNAWAITAAKNDFIYQFTTGNGAVVTEELEWQPTEGEYSLINVAEQDGALYAEIYNQTKDTIEIRKYSKSGAWSDVMTVTPEEDGWNTVGSGFFVDSSQNVYLVNGSGKKAARFDGAGGQSCQYTLGGTVCYFKENEDGTVECVTAEENGVTLYELSGDGAEEIWTREESEPVGQVCGIGSSETGTLCLATNQELLFLDEETGSLLAKTELVKLGVSSVLTGYYDAGEGTLQLYEATGNSDGLRYRLLAETEDAGEQRTELVYGMVGGMNADTTSSIWTAIATFNAESEDYYVTIKNYDWNTDRRQADMAAGTGPDILDMSVFDNYEVYAKNGYLEDLMPYLEQSEYQDDIIWNLLDAYKIDGGLYVLLPQVQLDGILIHPDYEPTVEEWNLETFLALIEENQWEKDLFGYAGEPEYLLWVLLCGRQEEWIDWEQQTASFESESFLDMLELCKEYSQADWSKAAGWTTYEEQEWNSLCMKSSYGGDFAYYLSETEVYGREYPIYGYPTLSGQTYGVEASEDACAIYSGSSHKEGAWEFVESLLWDSNQEYLGLINAGFPIRASLLEEMAAEAGDTTMNVNGELLTISESEVEIVKDILYNGNVSSTSVNLDIWSVIEEETASYFAGDKTAEEVAHIIQSRVEIILQE